MLALALDGHPGFAAADFELRQPGASYTIHTVRRLREAGASEVLLVIGGDSLVDLPGWYEPEALIRESRVVVVGRQGAVLEQVPEAFRRAVSVLTAPRIDVSSTEIRARVAAGRSIRYLVPESVREYIEREGLYR